jgi:glycosyltransferase involved in cell wall biosynthesis
MTKLGRATETDKQPRVALLPWGNVIEDWLVTTGLSLESFLTDFTGSWMFGYADALRRSGVQTVIVCFSSEVSDPRHVAHPPSGATIVVLPAPWIFKLLRRVMRDPYGATVRHVFGESRGWYRLLAPMLFLLKEAAPYLSIRPLVLRRELRRQRCNAILCQEYESPRFDVCVVIGRAMGLPVFASFQGGDYQVGKLERLIRPLTIRRAHGLVIAAQRELERVKERYGLASKKLAHIANPIDLDVWKPGDRHEARKLLSIPANARVVAWHGRVSIGQKALDVLLDAWQLVRSREQMSPLRLLLVGSGQDAGELRQKIQAIGEDDIVWIDQFISDRATVAQYLSAADVYVFPSRHEGFAVALIEAMGCGLPVVATDANGVQDVLGGGEVDGGVVVPRDDPQALAQALGRVLGDDLLGRKLGQQARERVEECCSQEAVGRRLARFLFPSMAQQGASNPDNALS